MSIGKINKTKHELNKHFGKNKQQLIENNLEVEDTKEKNEEEQYSDTFILVHVSGAVNKEGVVELKANSRISDAIDKARRIKRRC